MVFFRTNSQIVIGNESSRNQKKVSPKNSKSLTNQDGNTTLCLTANRSTTFRQLKENSGLFGDTLGNRAGEKALKTWSFSIGFQNRIGQHLQWGGGISLLKNGEQYEFKASDTSYSYTTVYSYIGMPIKINYLWGNVVKFYVGTGLVPQLLSGYQQQKKWTTSKNAIIKETDKNKVGFSPFVLSAFFNAGISLNFNNEWGVLIVPEYRLQLNSSYLKYDKFIHKANALGISFGLIRNL